MAADDKKSKPREKTSVDAPPKEKAAAQTPAGVDAKADAPKNYSRGEGQKPVSQAYKDNWNAIFAKKKR